jgi:hypothetical protein
VPLGWTRSLRSSPMLQALACLSIAAFKKEFICLKKYY